MSAADFWSIAGYFGMYLAAGMLMLSRGGNDFPPKIIGTVLVVGGLGGIVLTAIIWGGA